MDDEDPRAGWTTEPSAVFGLASHTAELHDLFMQTTLPQALTDPTGRFVMANRAYCDLVGYTEDDLLMRTVESITHKDDVPSQQRALEILSSGQSATAHASPRYLRGDGGTLQCRVALAVIRDDSQDLRFFHTAVEQVRPTTTRGIDVDDSPVVVPEAVGAINQIGRVLPTLRTGQAQVVFLSLEGLERIAGVLGWPGIERAHAQIVSRVAKIGGVGIRSIVPLGSSYLLIVADTDDPGSLPSVLHSTLRTPVALGGVSVPVGIRMGLSTGTAGDDPDTLIRRARVALNEAERTGAPEVHYRPELDAEALSDFALTIEIAHALADNDFHLHYQPKYDLDSMEPVGFEALLRWDHPDRGPVPPDKIVRLAESSGLIAPLTIWVIDTAAAQAAAWRDAGTPARVAVNISPGMLTNPMLPLRLSMAVGRHSLPANAIELEITETALSTGANAIAAVQQLAELGYWIHIDDFGTGYSSLAAIRSLPLRAVKIDRTFVQNLLVDTRDRAVVSAITEVAHQLGARVVAEGVEDEVTLDLLRILGCDMVQGFHLGRPVPPDQVGDHLRPLRIAGQLP